MADVRRARKTSKRSEAKHVSPDDHVVAEKLPSAHDDDSERALARLLATLVPVLGVAAAAAVGALVSIPSAVLVLAGTALLGTIGFFWASLRTLSGDAPLPAGVASHAMSARAPLPERKREALRALKDLELDHSIGKIDDADYRELEARYRSTAKALMRELDEGLAPKRDEAERLVERYLAKRDLAPGRTVPASEARETGAESEARVPPRTECAKCGVSNEPDAAFCKKCGAPMVAPTSTEERTDAPV